jgi:glutathione peroxidase
MEECMIYDFKVTDNKGEVHSLEEYKDKVLLIVNTATACGFTPQYEGLQKLYETYHDRGFEILDFPCNQFGAQAPGTDEEIKEFCTGRFGVTFPIFSKIDVNGPKADPLFEYLKSEKKGALGKKIKWNFTKFLIDRQGKVIKRYAPADIPEKIAEDVASML